MTVSEDVAQGSSPNLAIARAVTMLREDRGLTVDQLAVYAGLNRASMYRKLKGEAGWKATDVAALASYFGVQPNDLFSGRPIGGGTPRTSPKRVKSSPGARDLTHGSQATTPG
jgi:transcriptional regulator with XRE-family HTH domain